MADGNTALLEKLAGVSTPTVLNALKRLGVHPADLESFDRRVVGCMSPALGVRVGYAATRRVATRRTEPESPVATVNQPDQHLLTVPAPRFLVVENVGDWQGPVSIWGEVGATLYRALDCVAGVTNGPVRDLEEMEAVGFATFAGGPGVGGGFVDVLEVGAPVEVGGVTVRSGDLIHGDRHGVVKIPFSLADRLPGAIAAVERTERRVMAVTHKPGFTLDEYYAAWREPSPRTIQ